MLGGEEHRLDVDLHHASPGLGRLVDDRAAAADADVVVEEVEPAEAVERGGDHAAALGVVGEVGLMRGRGAAFRRDHGHRALGQGQVAVDDQHAGAGPGQQDRRRPAVADAVAGSAASGDDGDLAGQAGIVCGSRLRANSWHSPGPPTSPACCAGDLANLARFNSNGRGRFRYSFEQWWSSGEAVEAPAPPRSQSDHAMLLPPEAFTHVPALAGKIVEPEKSFYRLTRDRLKEFDRIARENGYPENWRLTDEQREATRAAVLAGRSADLWLFAYGSLMWDPGVHIVEIRTATLHGFHRSFCLKSRIGRGSAENPALMAALDHGGTCSGLALRIPGEHVDRETEILWMREMLAGSYVPTVVPVETPQGSVEAADVRDQPHQSDRYVQLDIEETARLIATGRGIRGTSLEYLENVGERLDLLGLSDPAINDLRQRVRQFLEPRPQP